MTLKGRSHFEFPSKYTSREFLYPMNPRRADLTDSKSTRPTAFTSIDSYGVLDHVFPKNLTQRKILLFFNIYVESKIAGIYLPNNNFPYSLTISITKLSAVSRGVILIMISFNKRRVAFLSRFTSNNKTSFLLPSSPYVQQQHQLRLL